MPPYKVTVDTVANKMNILIYGNQGSGKTYLAATAQDHKDMSPVLVLNTDGGLMTLAGRGDIDAEDVTSVEQLEEIFWKIQEKDPEYKKYKTIIIDSVTELQSLNLLELVNKNIKKKNQQKIRTQDDIYQEDYGKSTTQLRRVFRMFRDCPINTIMIALPKYKFPSGATDASTPAEVMPSLTTKLGDSLMGFVDFVWYLYKEDDDKGNEVRKLLTRDHGVYRAKTRGVNFSNALGLIYDNPTMPDLYELFIDSEVTL